MSRDLAAIRAWVTGADHLQYANLPDHMVSVHVTHEHLKVQMIELRFDRHTTIEAVKDKIFSHCGTKPCFQRLVLYPGEVLLDDDSKMLGYYSITNGSTIHVHDTDPHSLAKGGWIEDTSLVEKYIMTDEEYDKRENTLRGWARENKRKDPTWVEPWKKPNSRGTSEGNVTNHLQKVENDDTHNQENQQRQDDIVVGQRCEVFPGGRRGVIRYKGVLPGNSTTAELLWVGIELDEPLGKHDGVFMSVRYFTCPPKHGIFAKACNVRCGDFPPRSLDDEDEL